VERTSQQWPQGYWRRAAQQCRYPLSLQKIIKIKL
jgi:hypothetical protein